MGSIPEPAAVTMAGIPDPLGALKDEEEPAPKFEETPTPLFNERVDVLEPAAPPEPLSTPSTPAPVAPKDNRLIYIAIGCGLLSVLCVCLVIVLVLTFNISG
jgi:hypothetical protein